MRRSYQHIVEMQGQTVKIGESCLCASIEKLLMHSAYVRDRAGPLRIVSPPITWHNLPYAGAGTIQSATTAVEAMYNLWEMESRREEPDLDAIMHRLKDLSAYSLTRAEILGATGRRRNAGPGHVLRGNERPRVP